MGSDLPPTNVINMVDKNDITRIRVTAGEQNREWEVESHQRDDQYVVHYVDKDKKSKLVDTKQSPACKCTYREYNQTCTHEQAVEKFEEIIETVEDTGYTLKMGDAVHCRICDKVHAGKCDRGEL